MMFHSPPSAALKTTVVAALVSYVGVAIMGFDGCTSQYGACILTTPALLVYWAPGFVAAWVAIAVVLKLVDPRRPVLPSIHVAGVRETAFLRSRGQGAAAGMAAAVVYLVMEYAVHALTVRLTGEPREVAGSLDGFLHTRVGVALVVGVVFIFTIILLRRIQGPVPDDWDQLKQ